MVFVQGRHFMLGETENFKLLQDISFDNDFQKNFIVEFNAIFV